MGGAQLCSTRQSTETRTIATYTTRTTPTRHIVPWADKQENEVTGLYVHKGVLFPFPLLVLPLLKGALLEEPLWTGAGRLGLFSAVSIATLS